jgi:hypothetical protein
MIEFKIKNKIRNITIYILLKKKLKLKKKVVEFFFFMCNNIISTGQPLERWSGKTFSNDYI